MLLGARLNLRGTSSFWASLAHGFSGRGGGVSAPPFDSLNLSYAVGDRSEDVDRNWDTVRAAGPERAAWVRIRQVHGARVVRAGAAAVDLGDADGAIATASGTVVSVLTADCVPILLAADGGRAVAAIHAGWRGTAAGIVAATVRMLEVEDRVDPTSLHALIGPAIGPCCYEVGDDVVTALRQRPALASGASSVGIETGATRPRVDLRRANHVLLTEAGVAPHRIELVGPCTRCAADRYFSHRAARGGATGRQLSWISLSPSGPQSLDTDADAGDRPRPDPA